MAHVSGLRNQQEYANPMIDIEEAKKLVHALEKDLSAVQDGSAGIQNLKDEVKALKAVLESPEPEHDWVSDALRNIHTIIDEGTATAKIDAIIAGRYIASIGRMLGL